MSRTKIVATIGPASNNDQTIGQMIDAGMNVARVNFSHGNRESATVMVNRIRTVAEQKGKKIAILGDLQGPKLRIGMVPGGGELDLQIGQQVTLSADPDDKTDGVIPFPHPELMEAINQGARLVMGDGEVVLQVMAKRGMHLVCATTVAGPLGSRKGVNLPGTFLPIPSVTEKDKVDLVTAIELDMDYVALSFVRAASDIDELRDLMLQQGLVIPIIAKIEKSEAIDALEEIRDVCDGMMVARGDLGIDLPTHEIPFLQKKIIRTCNEVGKPVITATQMLQSMTENPTPTRAEATDVANAILDGTDAVMLSAESANGKFPVKSVAMMRSIATMTEQHFPYEDWNQRRYEQLRTSMAETSDAISAASCGIARHLSASAIITTTVSGSTARQVARWRPAHPIVALSPREKTCRQLALTWGVESTSVPDFGTIDDMIEDIAPSLQEIGFVVGDRVVVTAGVPFGRRGLTNVLQVHEMTEEDFDRE